MTTSIEPSPQVNSQDAPFGTCCNTVDLGETKPEILMDTSDAQKECGDQGPDKNNVVELRPRQDNHNAWCRLKDSAEKCNQEGNYSEASKNWLAAFEEAKNMAPAIQWYSLDNLSSTYLDLKQSDQAELYSTLAVEVAKELQLDPCYLARSLNTLAGALYHQGRFAEAEPLAVQVLRIYNKTLGRDHADVGTAANNLAMVYHAQSKFQLAEMLYQRAVEIRTKILGSDHPSVVTVMANHSVALVGLQVSQQLERPLQVPNEVVATLNDVLWERITG